MKYNVTLDEYQVELIVDLVNMNKDILNDSNDVEEQQYYTYQINNLLGILEQVPKEVVSFINNKEENSLSV